MLRHLFLAAMTIVMIGYLGLAGASADEPNDGPEVTAEQMREWYPCPYAGLDLSVEEEALACEIYAVKWLGWSGLYVVEPEPTPDVGDGPCGDEPCEQPEPIPTVVPEPAQGQSEAAEAADDVAKIVVSTPSGLRTSSAASPTPIASSWAYAPVLPVPGDPSLEPPRWWLA